MSTIRKPEANPILAAALTWLALGCGHMVVNGQQRKWIFTMIAAVVGTLFCCLPGTIVGLLSIFDAYQTALRLQAGEEIGENEYSVEMLYKIISKIDSTATFKG
jgi:predicted Co/Zn/Cd cation transporter (cation efflux family)